VLGFVKSQSGAAGHLIWTCPLVQQVIRKDPVLIVCRSQNETLVSMTVTQRDLAVFCGYRPEIYGPSGTKRVEKCANAQARTRKIMIKFSLTDDSVKLDDLARISVPFPNCAAVVYCPRSSWSSFTIAPLGWWNFRALG
jgi:hypothetical protein